MEKYLIDSFVRLSCSFTIDSSHVISTLVTESDLAAEKKAKGKQRRGGSLASGGRDTAGAWLSGNRLLGRVSMAHHGRPGGATLKRGARARSTHRRRAATALLVRRPTAGGARHSNHRPSMLSGNTATAAVSGAPVTPSSAMQMTPGRRCGGGHQPARGSTVLGLGGGSPRGTRRGGATTGLPAASHEQRQWLPQRTHGKDIGESYPFGCCSILSSDFILTTYKSL